MSKITPENSIQRPVNTPIPNLPDTRTLKTEDAGDVQAKSRRDEADKGADNKAKLAKTTGKVPPDRTGLDTEEHATAGKGAEGLRETRRARAAKDEAGADDAKNMDVDEGNKRQADDAARLIQAQSQVIKVP